MTNIDSCEHTTSPSATPLAVLELPVDGATTTKLRGELVPSKPPPEVIKLTQRLGLAAVNPADVVQVAPEVDVMYTGELLPVSTKRARVRVTVHESKVPGA